MTATLKSLARKVSITCRYGASLDHDKQDDWQRNTNGFRCTLKYKGRQYSFDFWQGVGISDEPNAQGCLDCLLSDASAGEQSFDEFCGEFGYDSDSRKAERIHAACEKTAKAIRRLLGDDFETFLYADRND